MHEGVGCRGRQPELCVLLEPIGEKSCRPCKTIRVRGTNRREAEGEPRETAQRFSEVEEVRRSAEFGATGFSGEALAGAGALVLVILGLADIFPLWPGRRWPDGEAYATVNQEFLPRFVPREFGVPRLSGLPANR